MASLIDVFRLEEHPKLLRRQSPLMIEDNLMMVMDLNNLELVDDYGNATEKEYKEFLLKYNSLTEWELKMAFKVEKEDVMNILSESIPCVGCRRSVERLYYQLMEVGSRALDPLLVNSHSLMMVREQVLKYPQTLCNILSTHSQKLNRLVNGQLRNKKSRRCVLHSWDVQKNRPVTPAWRDVWGAMSDKCKAEVLLIDYTMLYSKLENYLKKHRFCQDCRTKVMKAYSLLIEDVDPTKEKGFVPALYNKIKRCTPGKHIHLPVETDYIDSLIARAEPELMGNRRDRHAKTMEIAQEEVLTCVGICIYDRLHRIYLRLREEEFTFLVLAAAAVESLFRSFETQVEKKRGVSRLELLYQEITKEELAKQQRKEMKKLKKKRKKQRGIDGRKGCECESDELEATDEHACECPKVKPPLNGDRQKLQILDRKSKGQVKCACEECQEKQQVKSIHRSDFVEEDNDDDDEEDEDDEEEEEGDIGEREDCASCEDSREDRAHDGGYGSEHNLPSSGSNSSPDGSEVACSEGFCDHDGECGSGGATERGGKGKIQGMSLEEMLEVSHCDGEDCVISPEEILAFKAQSRQMVAKRQELRAMLKTRFDELCKAQGAQV